MIYHYTTPETLLKVIESKSLWMSDISKMNDPKELTQGFEVILKHYSGGCRHLNEMLQHLDIFYNDKCRFVSVSFSKKKDCLNQWRAYGADGKGVSIGIEDNTHYTHARLEPVIYSKDQLILKVKNVVTEFCYKFKQSKPSKEELVRLFWDLLDSVAFYKDSFYESEQEVRATSILDTRLNIRDGWPDIKYRNSPRGIIFYTEFSLYDSRGNPAVKSLTLGPKCNLEERDLLMALQVEGLKVDIDYSAGHYR